MKKLFCLALFAMGFFVSIEAQTLNYYLENSSSTDTWFFKMEDANGNQLNFATILPGGSVNSTLPGTFAFPLSWSAEDSNGCGTSGTITAPVGPTYPTYPCSSPPSAMKYQLVQTGPLSYLLEFGFD